jgi:glucose-1-phosphatase
MKKKAIILDFGGVLLNVDYEAPVKAFATLGFKDFKSIYAKEGQTDFVDEFEKGKISPSRFRDDLRKISGLNSSDQEIDAAWNSILRDFPADRMRMLEELKKKYRIFILSNTNEIHVSSFEKMLDDVYGKNHFQDQFEKVYYSSSVGMRKPDKEIFDFVLFDTDLEKEDVVFIDDSIQHVEGALKVGIDALHLDLKKEKIGELLKRGGLI